MDFNMEEKLIALARKVCKTNFMDYPDYDEDLTMVIEDALTILIMENVGNDEDVESVHVYDYVISKLT